MFMMMDISMSSTITLMRVLRSLAVLNFALSVFDFVLFVGGKRSGGKGNVSGIMECAIPL